MFLRALALYGFYNLVSEEKTGVSLRHIRAAEKYKRALRHKSRIKSGGTPRGSKQS